jgi:hypothetical protein
MTSSGEGDVTERFTMVPFLAREMGPEAGNGWCGHPTSANCGQMWDTLGVHNAQKKQRPHLGQVRLFSFSTLYIQNTKLEQK